MCERALLNSCASLVLWISTTPLTFRCDRHLNPTNQPQCEIYQINNIFFQIINYFPSFNLNPGVYQIKNFTHFLLFHTALYIWKQSHNLFFVPLCFC